MNKVKVILSYFLFVIAIIILLIPCGMLYFDLSIVTSLISATSLIISILWFFIFLFEYYKDSFLKNYYSYFKFFIKQFLKDEPNSLKAKPSIEVALFFYIWFLLIWGNIYYFTAAFLTDAFNKSNLGLLDAVYFSVVTSFTIGYGDLFPNHAITKIFVIFQTLSCTAPL